MFELKNNESIDSCLARIKEEGYLPIKRVEKPVFKEVMIKGESHLEPIGRQLYFEAVKNEQ
ncbi:NETI motif-containing protein [Amphibacillus sediminis]|uniref:NETI motif-containing protein n=1 Tax=Amphibacillus sediminis TaxID=360185 RepID=UPI001FE03DA0|nr:NETI motif-containing protein [Amphibacillus sediminis]